MSEKSTKLKVEGVPQEVSRSQLRVLLSNKRRQGGGPIDRIELTKGTAIVTFEESDAVDIILGRGDTVQLNDVTFKVTRYIDPDDAKLSLKKCRTSSKGSITAVDEQESSCDDLSDTKDLAEKVKKKSKNSIQETEKKKKKSVVKKQCSVPDEEAKTRRKKSKTYSQASDDDQINSSDEKSENELLHRESQNKTQKSVKEKTKNKSILLKASSSVKENLEQKTKMPKHAVPQDELSDTESQSEKPKNKKHKSLKEVSTKKKSSVDKKTTSDSDRDSKCYRKRSKANSRKTDDEQEISPDESTDNETSPEKPESKIHRSNKKSPKKEKSSVDKKTISDSDKDSKCYRKRSKANSQKTDDEQETSSDESTDSEGSPEKPASKKHRSHKKSPKKKKSSVAKKVTSDSEDSEEEDHAEMWETTIKAKVSDITKMKDFYVMYFEDPDISQGPFYEESFLLDGLNRNLYVTFCKRKAAAATASFKHKAASNLLKVEMATEEDFDTHSNLISVHGYSCNTAEQKRELKKKIEEMTTMEVVDIIQQDEPRSAIIVFNPDSCEDISAVTWMSVHCGNLRFIVAPVFKSNCVKLSGLNPLGSDDTVQRYMSNSKRSGGGIVTSFQRLNTTEACVVFKERESVDGVIARNPHSLEGYNLQVSPHHPCLSTEVYKKQVEPLMQQLKNNTDAPAGPSETSRHVQPRQGPRASRPLRTLHSKLNFRKVSLCTYIDRTSKKTEYTLKLCKFGYEFLNRQARDLTEIMLSVHCKYTLVSNDNVGLMILRLDWPHKMRYNEVREMFDSGTDKVRNYLDTFTAAQFEIPYSYEFQQYYLMMCQEESLGFDIFFDHLEKLACVICKQNEHFIENKMNTLYQKFMSSTLCLAASDHHRQNENMSQKRTGLNTKQGNQEYDGKQADGFKNTNQKKKPPLASKPPKEKNTTKGKEEEEELMSVQFTLEQELEELGEKDIILFEKTHFHKDLENKLKPLQIILNNKKMCAVIKSNEQSKIDHAQVELLKKTRDFIHMDVTSLFSPEQLQLLNKQEVQNKINSTFLEMGYQAHFRCSSGTVSIYHVKDVDSKLLKDVATCQVTTQKKPLDKDKALILQSEKGLKFLADICEISDGVKVSSCVKMQDNHLHIVTSAQQLDIVLQAIDHFIEENKSYEKPFLFSSGKQKFVEKCFSQELAQIKSSLIPLGAKIVEHADRYTVQGLKDGVMEGEKRLSQLSDKILVQEVTLKYFGIKEFLQKFDGKSLLAHVENTQNCVISSTTDLPSGQGNTPNFRGKQQQAQKPPSLIALTKVGECSIMFQQGDITCIDTDAIVNPLDSTLKCNSGLAKALVLKGGHSIQTEVASSQKVGHPGEVIATSAGNMDKCKTIIHVICPIFNGTGMDDLERATAACLRHSTSQNLKSIAIPALGTGKIFNFDTFVACQRLIKALHQHLKSGDSTLTNIYLCDTKADHVKELIERFKNIFGQDVENVGSLQDVHRDAAPPVPQPRTLLPKVFRGQKNFRHIKVSCVPGEIGKQKTDTIVVTVGKNLDLSKGTMTRDIVKYGGDIVQQELTSNYGDGIQPGEFGQTSGGNLQCKTIFYARLHHWRGSSEHMSKLVYKLLQNADQQGSASMSIPAIGTGNLGYPADTAADVITNTICQFAMDNPNSTLKLINLVVFPRAADVVKAFQDVLSTGGPRSADASASGHIYTRSSHQENHKGEQQIKSVKLKIKKGDITSEKCDAIICGIRETMDMSSSGAVSKSLLKKCGTALQDECISKKDEMAQKGFIATSAPSLNCQHIFHVSMDRFSRSWDRCVSQVLAEAESQGCTSVGIPALGAGSRKADYKRIKQSILKGVKYFASNSQKTLKDVRLVVFSQDMLDEFLDDGDSPRQESRGHEDESPANVMAAVSDHVDLKIYADSHKNIASATKTLNDVVKAAFREEKENNEQLKRFDKHQVRQLEDEGSKNCVKVSVSIEESVISMRSFNKDGILNVHKLLKTLLMAVLENHHKSLHRAVQSTIIWQFENEKWRDFEPLLNSELEREYKKKSKHYDITDARGRTYRVDFAAMKEIPLDNNGQPHGQGFNVRRFDRTKEGERLPKEWERMKSDENLKVVTLQAGSPEFKAAEQRFIQGGVNVPIKKIERIQNKSLYQQYKAKKRELDHRNPKGHKNEQRLFHGTDSASVTAINENGFNRSYCGKNATAYGDGVYFAVNSSYSLGYTRPSGQGERQMYIVRVLTGESTPSSSGMKHLPNKPGTNIPYDSGTAGSIFIIFHDTQAYPEHLITF